MRSIGVAIACAGVLLNLTAAYALPKRIIILRHAEKSNDENINNGGLCGPGPDRAQALSQYLGSAAGPNSLFENGEKPAAFYANTCHSAETIAPASATWKGVVLNTCPPFTNGKCGDDCKGEHLDKWSSEAAHKVLNNAEYNGKTVVMAWEHARIADAALDEKNPDPLTLYRLLGIYNYFNGVDLSNWCGTNYDYFWIVDYDPDNPNSKNGAPTPKSITISQQKFDAPYDTLPTNAWGEPEQPWDPSCTPTPNPQCPKQQ
jgi:hypothetical protein